MRRGQFFFAQHDFLVGLSIDGPEDVHDTYRVDKGGKASFARVIEGLHQLERRGIVPNFLCTLTAASETHGGRIYRFLRDEFGGALHSVSTGGGKE